MRRNLARVKADLAQFGLDASKFRVVIGGDEWEDPAHVGLCVFSGEQRTIYLRPHLRGSELYRIYLHELGHAFGLDHTQTGVMAPNVGPSERADLEPTPAQRKRWCFEVAEKILKHRRRAWQP